MTTKLRFLLLPVLWLSHATASDTTSTDALTASPANFRLLLENEHVRVLEYTLQPGEKDQAHTHPPKVSYVLSGGSIQISTEDGKSFLADESAGQAMWSGAIGKHFVENVGQTPVKILLVEVKSAAVEK